MSRRDTKPGNVQQRRRVERQVRRGIDRLLRRFARVLRQVLARAFGGPPWGRR